MDKSLYKIIEEVGCGNPGAYKVINELQWFTNWEKMLRYLKDINLTGSALWAKVADEYHHSFHDFGHAIDKEMSQYYSNKNGLTKDSKIISL